MIQYSAISVNLFLMLDGGGGACYNIHKEALPADGSPPLKEKTMTVILRGGWGGHRFLLRKMESRTNRITTSMIKYSMRTPPFGGTIEPPSLAQEPPLRAAGLRPPGRGPACRLWQRRIHDTIFGNFRQSFPYA